MKRRVASKICESPFHLPFPGIKLVMCTAFAMLAVLTIVAGTRQGSPTPTRATYCGSGESLAPPWVTRCLR